MLQVGPRERVHDPVREQHHGQGRGPSFAHNWEDDRRLEQHHPREVGHERVQGLRREQGLRRVPRHVRMAGVEQAHAHVRDQNPCKFGTPAGATTPVRPGSEPEHGRDPESTHVHEAIPELDRVPAPAQAQRQELQRGRGRSSGLEDQPRDGHERELERGDVRDDDPGSDLRPRHLSEPESGLGRLHARLRACVCAHELEHDAGGDPDRELDVAQVGEQVQRLGHQPDQASERVHAQELSYLPRVRAVERVHEHSRD